jgi:hypothetical protein
LIDDGELIVAHLARADGVIVGLGPLFDVLADL